MPPTPKASITPPKIDQFLSNRHRQIGINSSFLLLNLTHLLEPAEAWCCLDLNGRKCFGDQLYNWGVACKNHTTTKNGSGTITREGRHRTFRKELAKFFSSSSSRA